MYRSLLILSFESDFVASRFEPPFGATHELDYLIGVAIVKLGVVVITPPEFALAFECQRLTEFDCIALIARTRNAARFSSSELVRRLLLPADLAYFSFHISA